jgi:hypothetical protein
MRRIIQKYLFDPSNLVSSVSLKKVFFLSCFDSWEIRCQDYTRSVSTRVLMPPSLNIEVRTLSNMVDARRIE